MTGKQYKQSDKVQVKRIINEPYEQWIFKGVECSKC